MSFFQGSQGTNVDGGTFVGVNGSHNNVSVVVNDKKKRKGVELLLGFCIPQAIHDSGARGDLGCYPGTREEYIRNVTNWGRGEWNSGEKRAFLMTGPAGAGKSAIAQTCADELEASGNLGASFFFFRPSGWNDPKKFIPTIVYQLVTRYPAYRDYIDAVILDDRLVLEKAIDIQFRELLVKPLLKLHNDGRGVKTDSVIIVDGLDECATVDAQTEIMKLITTSILEQTTPFLWAFFNRPEPPITSAFSPDAVKNISWELPLTLSSDVDRDIEAYIRGSFEMIRAKYCVPPDVAWPKEADIRRLVSQSAGLFVYPATAMRYIGNGSSRLEQRLRFILQLDSTSTENPFSGLDQLYLLMMKQIPEGVLFDTLSLLYLDQRIQSHLPHIHKCCSILGLSPMAFYATISNLYSVLEVVELLNGTLMQFKFYHRSFTDFLFDETRSQQYFLESPDVIRHCLNLIVETLANASVTASNGEVDGVRIYLATGIFFAMVADIDGELDDDTLRQMLEINWGYRNIPVLVPPNVDIRKFIQKIPKDWRHRIIRPSREGLSGIGWQILANINQEKYEASAYIIGKGSKAALMVRGPLTDTGKTN